MSQGEIASKMGNEIRRTLDELVTRYELEPELRDIYVEGKTDKLFFEWFLEKKLIQNFVVYEIDTVDIPAQRIFELGLIDNKRSRVIALALDMQVKLQSMTPNLTCIADKDFDALFGIEYQCDLLLFTDYSCLEMYLLNEGAIDKFLRLTLRLSEPIAKEAIPELTKVLEELFLIRAVNKKLDINVELLDRFGDCCSQTKKKNHIEFALDKYIGKYVNKCRTNGIKIEKPEFTSKLEELRITAQMLLDVRDKIHGHDFTELLAWYIKPYIRDEIKNYYNSEVIAGSLLGCVDAEQLTQEGLFQKLLTRVSN